MFPLLPAQWTPAVALAALGGNPVALRVAGESLMAFRDHAKRWHALLDRCPHRGARLSRGTVMDDGTLHYAEGGTVAHSEVTPTEWGMRTLNAIGRRGDEANLHVFSIPVEEDHTRVMTVRRLPPGTDAFAWSARNGGVDNPILNEDRAVVESQSIAFRRWYHRELMRT